ncbi:hypothetical protein MPSEU_000594100 [Mayamaea pseudoterrestris]|nr:hypothetical protein MPSEU_000594100 [Mayamaea pseudoterrestris]
MMQASPSTPPGASNGFNTRQRQRVGGDVPYRDDPNAPISSRYESFTYGGLGPAMPSEKSKKLSVTRRCWNTASDVCRCICSAHHNPHDETLYYEDHFNDMSWSCNTGTADDAGIWLNQNDPAGSIMSFIVWLLILYSQITMTFLAQSHGISSILSLTYCILASLALACHLKTSLTDPGSVPQSAIPTEAQRMLHSKLSMCSQCQSFKPPHSHHCRICNRCISRMDHHCPWMNNCVGAANMKHFLLFLIYTWSSSVLCLLLFGWNYFFCADEQCVFSIVLTQMVRIMTVLCIGAFLFTSSMLMNVVYGIMTGIGTIDRLKKKANNTLGDSEEEAIPLEHIFGIGAYWTWPLPVDPVFPDYDLVMGYSTPQRLLREQMRIGGGMDGSSVADSYGMPV